MIAEVQFLLYTLNEHLTRTALLAQPVQLAAVGSSEPVVLATIDLPLPLPGGASAAMTVAAAPPPAAVPDLLTPTAAPELGAWNPFADPADDLVAVPYDFAAAVADAASPPAPNSSGNGLTVTGFRASGEPEPVHLPASFAGALTTLGLAGSLGYIRLVRHEQMPGAAPGSGPWVPLQLCLGMPMQPCELCQAVCDAACSSSFLDARSRRRQQEGQAVLQQALDALIAEHGGWNSFVAGGKDDDLSSHVDRPARNFLVSSQGLVQVAPTDLSASLQGLPMFA